MPLFKFQKCLRVSRPESIDALILITDHEQIFRACCQQCNDRMLDLGGVLCFIHTDVGIQLLKIRQQPGDLLQHHIGIDHLIVVIDHLQFFQFAAIFPIDHRYLTLCLFIQSLDLVLTKHHIFNISNQCTNIFQISVCGIYPFYPLIDLRQEPCDPLFVIQKLMGCLSCSIAIILQHFGTDAVDGPKFQLLCQFRSKFRCKTCCHVFRSCHGISHGQDSPRVYAFAVDHISKPCYQYRCLARSRHRQ